MRCSLLDAADAAAWRDALDLVTGRDGEADIEDGLRLARQCRHPDAQWLASLFPAGESVSEKRLAHAMAWHEKDPRAMYVSFWLSPHNSSGLLLHAAHLGCAPAQADVARLTSASHPESALRFAERAASQMDREGLCVLARCLMSGHACDTDVPRAVAMFEEAAELGSRDAQYECGFSFPPSDARRYRWWGRAAARGSPEAVQYLERAAESQMRLLEQGNAVHPLVSEVARALTGRRDRSGEQRASKGAQRCLVLHNAWRAKAGAAAQSWLGVARRLALPGDMRRLIAKLLWAQPWAWSADCGNERERNCLSCF
jgi:hypothetical protein